jgi:hypothetical protein
MDENSVAFKISNPFVSFLSPLKLIIYQEFMMKVNSLSHTYVGHCTLSEEFVIQAFVAAVISSV